MESGCGKLDARTSADTGAAGDENVSPFCENVGKANVFNRRY